MARRWQGKRCLRRELAHLLGKLAVLRQGGRAHAVHGQQAFVPVALKEQALLRAVAQMALVVTPAPGHLLAQAQLLQQVLHFPGAVAGQGQVVRPQRAGQARQRTRTAVAAGLRLQLQQGHIVLTGQAQRPRRRQARHAAPGNHHGAVVRGRRRGQRMALRQLVAQRMAVRQGVGIGKATGQLGGGPLASQQRQRSSGSQEVAALHGEAGRRAAGQKSGAGRQSAQRWRISNSCGTSGKKCSTSVGSKCCPASDWMSAQACSVGQAFL